MFRLAAPGDNPEDDRGLIECDHDSQGQSDDQEGVQDTIQTPAAGIHCSWLFYKLYHLSTVRHPSVKSMSEKVLAKSDERVAMAC